MSVGHVVVGGGHMAEQAARIVGQIAGQGPVIVGGGHFLERSGKLVQEFANHVQIGGGHIGSMQGANNVFSRISTDSTNFFESGKVFFENPKDWQPIKTGGDLDSRAWEDRNSHFSEKAKDVWNDFKDSHQFEAIKEGLIAGGCGAAGDYEGLLDHGYQSLYQRSLEGKDFWDGVKKLAEKNNSSLPIGSIPSKPVFPDSMFFRGTWNDNAAAIPEIGTWQNDIR